MRFLQNQGYRTYGKIDEKNNAKLRVPKSRKIGAKRDAKSNCRRRTKKNGCYFYLRKNKEIYGSKQKMFNNG